MIGTVSFDIYLLGLKDPSPAGRARFRNLMARLTDRTPDDAERLLESREIPLFRAISQARAGAVVQELGNAGVRIEIRPNHVPAEQPDREAGMTRCPRCGLLQKVGLEECGRCGLVFAKWEREKVQGMQREKRLEDALSHAIQLRQKWDERATKYLEEHHLTAKVPPEIRARLHPEEIVFLAIESPDGPIVLTSRRLLSSRKDGVISVPYELMADVDFGKGLLKRGEGPKVQISLHAPISIGAEGSVKKLSWKTGPTSSVERDVFLNWSFSRKFVCGSCGSMELDYRVERRQVCARCTRCATDHEIDLDEAIAIPIIME